MMTDKEIYIINHINDRPRTKVAEDAGVSLSYLYNIVREHNGEMRKDLSEKRENWVYDYIREHYSDEDTESIARYVGLSHSSVVKWANRMGVFKSEEFNRKHILKLNRRMRSEEENSRRLKKWKLTRRMDEILVLSGGK